MNRVFLIGLPGSGKTSLGKELAESMNFEFLDLDEEIEKKHGPISEIFRLKGETVFREIERETLILTLFKRDVVVACGGGTACFFNTMDWMNWNGTTVFLRRNMEALITQNGGKLSLRPMFLGLEEEEMRHKMEELLNKREYFYLKSSFIFETNQHFQKTLESDIQDIVFGLSNL